MLAVLVLLALFAAPRLLGVLARSLMPVPPGLLSGLGPLRLGLALALPRAHPELLGTDVRALLASLAVPLSLLVGLTTLELARLRVLSPACRVLTTSWVLLLTAASLLLVASAFSVSRGLCHVNDPGFDNPSEGSLVRG